MERVEESIRNSMTPLVIPSMSVCAEIYVRGLVQGVCYRAFTREAANGLGLSGYCRNLPDGRVEVSVEGDRVVIERLIERLRVGPPRGQVEDLEIVWKPAENRGGDFSIRYD